MSRLLTFLASLLIVSGLTACCCPCGLVPRQPIVVNAPQFDPPPALPVEIHPPPQPVKPLPAEEKIANLIDPPKILDIKVELPIAYDKNKRFAFLDLSTKGNVGRLDGHFFGDNHFGELDVGVHMMADVPINVQERYLLLHNIKLIPNVGVGSKMRKLHVVHAAHRYGNPERPIAYYVLRYTDNTKAVFPIHYGRHVVNWWFKEQDPLPTESQIAWRGSNRPAKGMRSELIVYLTTFDNPHPQKTVHTIDYVFGDFSGAHPFCLAMTIEK